ncbi:MAG: hypothetical protein AB7G75_15695, partial [Candidatus Binatia bacterium]
MRKRKLTKYVIALTLALCCGGIASAGEKAASKGKVAGAEKSVAQEILDILRANNQIDAQQYESLLTKAKTEEARRQAGEKKVANAMQTYWKDGLNIEGGDDAKFKFKIGGYFMSDFAYIDGDKN